MTIKDYIKLHKLKMLDNPPSKLFPNFFPATLLEDIPLANSIEVYSNHDSKCWVCLDLSANTFKLLDEHNRTVAGKINIDCATLGTK